MSDPVLIIGAGVAGMTVAVELADSGVKTVLVEKLSTTGGNALNLYKAFPTDDCFYCFEGNRWRPGIRKCFYRSALTEQPNIDLKMNCKVEEISGTPGKFSVKLDIGPQYIDPKKCTMCGLCIKKSKAFSLISPQCQPQAVVYDPEIEDNGTISAAEECPTKAINLDAKGAKKTISASDIVIATGYHEMQPVNVDEYGYGTHPNIITQLELARLLDPLGETKGALLRPSDGKTAKQVMMVQCVGSRDENYYPYCSKICCVFALKHAAIITQDHTGVDVSVVYMDIRTYDRYEKYYRDTRAAGVEFVRGRVSRIEPQSDGSLDIIVFDSLLNKYLKFSVDIFVLSSALEPSAGSSEIITSLGLKSASGFIGATNPETEVVVGNRIYACGSALGPSEVPESVTQARAVVSKILQNRM
ncbi:MAG: CoB--CoM heterodisulfide reductase iron-sulfur subunit A family protein [Candidatus Thorarchaeota archaeon]|nr:MAG: CoB--CoM heterodisulfide reductase iron-sulfur subunit A family protein [Candidatus Thorarchaeota archaeon]